jgi:hypothetical protein
MSPQDRRGQNVWQLLEQDYLASVIGPAKGIYAALSEIEKRSALKDFVRSQSVKSKRWANIAKDLLSADLDEWRQCP